MSLDLRSSALRDGRLLGAALAVAVTSCLVTAARAQAPQLRDTAPTVIAPSNGHEPPPVEPAGPAAPGPAPLAWSAQEIATARARCDVLLKPLQVEYEREEPYRDGECGTPAPVKVSKVSGVTLSQPSTLTCDMVAALGTWIKSDLQPLARKHLGAPITSLNVMSSYSCRAAYGRVGGRLSEHGKANAIDIGGFVTTKGETTSVLTAWGPTARDVRAEIAKAEAERKRSEDKATKEAHQRALEQAKQLKAQIAQRRAGGTTSGAATGPGAPPSVVPAHKETGTGLGFSPPNHLGAPKEGEAKGGSPAVAKPAQAQAVKPQPAPGKAAPASAPLPAGTPDILELELKRMQFMRELHASACKTFGTVLGPEANADHRNHFHLDMAERRMARSICE